MIGGGAEVAIRPAASADEEAVIALMEELFQPPGRRPQDYTRERARDGFSRYIESADADILLAEANGSVLGLATVCVDIRSIRFGLRCWLEDLIVASSSRSAGVGRRLLDAATEWARERGCTHLELDSGHGRKDAHRFYVGQGMAQGGLTFTRRIE